MKNMSTPGGGLYRVLPGGTFTKIDNSLNTDSSLSTRKPKSRKWIYVAGRILVLCIALALMAYSVTWATDGLWNIATITFIAGLVFFIPFILYGRKIKELNKIKTS